MQTISNNTYPRDSREFNILFPVVKEADKEAEYRKARDLADYYGAQVSVPTWAKEYAAVLVKFDDTLQSYYWKPNPRNGKWREVWRKIVDAYEPVPLVFEVDDEPEREHLDDLRQRIKRQVGITATSRQLGWDEVYIIAYGLFFKRTGIHPAVESSLTGEPAHLDVVFRIPDGPKILLDCVNEVLLKDLTK